MKTKSTEKIHTGRGGGGGRGQSDKSPKGRGLQEEHLYKFVLLRSDEQYCSNLPHSGLTGSSFSLHSHINKFLCVLCFQQFHGAFLHVSHMK